MRIKLWVIVSLFLLILLAGHRYIILATERGCGYNPLNHLFNQQECWCCGDSPVVSDFDMLKCINSSVRYNGFTCRSCNDLCKTERVLE